MSLQSPLGRALGRGSAHQGVAHWWVQRLTAIALIPLTLWFVLRIAGLPDYEYDTVRAWIATGWHPVWLILLVGTLAWHSALGVQVVLEDYVHEKGIKVAALVTSIFLHVLAVAAGAYAVLRVAFTFTAG
ncbi:MAG: succinate dehydrogenase, hydrophobic membrane anchor protein [Gammaproteobacteria bacterium]|jgi:succinate dehydrogenase / fumarate reductase membrane anchor subunit|nr:succinate dehydrogenase, hydrophobic membrane anchor protein [Gammaproteobacteria bacterium]